MGDDVQFRTSPADGRITRGHDGYSLQDVAKLLGLSRSMIRALIDAGYVSPMRGPRREYRFSFQDLVVLRTAQALVRAKVPTTRILRSLRRLRAQLPPDVPMSGLRVEAIGAAVVVREGAVQWQPDDGQYLLRFQVEGAGGRVAFLDAPGEPVVASAQALFERALSLEPSHPDHACALYRQAIAIDPSLAAAHTNLGRLLHERKRHAEAEAAYRAGLAQVGADETLLFNLALLLEDVARPNEAAEMYRSALASNPDLAQAHYNLALLCEAAGQAQEAIRHLAAYRRLSKR
ncbi:MAG TPA: tetratricopeptide repeat protein [Casimicrobiaceae bacterium]|nr:tetratricopeptide repeat protein [Casimicrobiaceae bacterium]